MTKYDFTDLPLPKQVTEKKKCSGCLLTKTKVCFNKQVRNNDGLKSTCKHCDSAYASAYRKTHKGLIAKIYARQKASCKERGHSQPKYSKLEFERWCLSQELFHVLYKDWSNSGYDKSNTPSVDRIDDYKSYSFENIQLMTWLENTNKAHSDAIEGRNNKRNKAVNQYSLKGYLLGWYHSISSASRETGVPAGCISRVCTKKPYIGHRKDGKPIYRVKKTAGGYIWKFAE